MTLDISIDFIDSLNMGISHLLMCGLLKQVRGGSLVIPTFLESGGNHYSLSVFTFFFFFFPSMGIFILTAVKVMRYIASPDAGGRPLIHVEVYCGKVISHIFHLVTISLIHSWNLKKKKLSTECIWMVTTGCL